MLRKALSSAARKPLVCVSTLQRTAVSCFSGISKMSGDEPWSREQVSQSLDDHGLAAWATTDTLQNLIHVERGEGPYIYDMNGKEYFDLSSQAICSSLGHTMPTEIRQAIDDQITKIPMVFGVMGVTEIRAKLGQLMTEASPADSDLNAWIFVSNGSEANECALRIARNYTGKWKIMTRRRAYHGGTLGALAMTGDSRTNLLGQMAPPGFVKMFDPVGGTGLSEFQWADEKQCLAALEEQILGEGPETIAAIWLESITGTCGWLKPSVEYVQGVRALCDKYEILLGFDEVMAGIARTGRMFAYEHFDVRPDIVTGAKGITGAYLPLGYVGVSKDIQEHFRTHPCPYGGTYQAHPTCLAAGYATMRYVLDNELVARSQENEAKLSAHMQRLQAKYPTAIHEYRCTGMAGAIDIAAQDGAVGVQGKICHYNDNSNMTMKALKQVFNDVGLVSLFRGPLFHVAPPLICTDDHFDDAFGRLDKAFDSVFG